MIMYIGRNGQLGFIKFDDGSYGKIISPGTRYPREYSFIVSDYGEPACYDSNYVYFSYGDSICSPGIIANFFQISIIWVTSVGNADS